MSAPEPATKSAPHYGCTRNRRQRTWDCSKEGNFNTDGEGTLYTENVEGRRRRRIYSLPTSVTYMLMKSGAQCRSRNKYYGCWIKSVADCAKNMKKEGKKFFVYFPGTKNLMYMDRKCYGEKTTGASFRTAAEACPEGFTSTGFNSKYSFYTVLD